MTHNDDILRLLGLARKAGKLEVGEEPVGAACRARKARLLVAASDAAPNTFRRIRHFGEAGNVLWLTLPCTKAELGNLLGRGSCAMAALMDAGFAATLARKLAAANPEQYGPAAEQLDGKAARVLKRQKEQRQHEKNLREGKRKPWAAPPNDRSQPSHAPGKADQSAAPAKTGPKHGKVTLRPGAPVKLKRVTRGKNAPTPPRQT